MTVPRLSVDAIRRIIEHGVVVVDQGLAVGDVFTREALACISDCYVRARVSIRRVVQLASEAFVEVVEADARYDRRLV